MNINRIIAFTAIVCTSLLYTGCKVPAWIQKRQENKNVPASYNTNKDSLNTAKIKWREFFTDPNLVSLIDTALKNNQELNIVMQEINVAKSEVIGRRGAYLPFLYLEGGAGVERSGLYTRNGVIDATNNIAPGTPIPDPLPNYLLAANVSWEIDIWKKLRNAKKSATLRYLSSIEGKNFMVTRLISEIASSYYELMAYDNQLEILQKNIEIQQNALEIVKLEKEAAKVTQLAVTRFEAEVLKNQSRLYYIQQQIIVAENRINFLVGRFPQPVQRSSKGFIDLVPAIIHSGIPSQLLQNRPDIRRAELDLTAAKLDVKIAKANFYPSFIINAGAGFNAFNAGFLFAAPSLLYNIAGDLVAPLINRSAIKSVYYSANAKQMQSVYNYERTVLDAYIEVANQLSNISNLEKSYDLKSKQVQALTQAITISTGLFKSARADYMEVLLTQRDALESKFDLIETKVQQLNAAVNVYRALGGGWN
ncbi:MAG: TolC family protein [Bacteroidia bacterium]